MPNATFSQSVRKFALVMALLPVLSGGVSGVLAQGVPLGLPKLPAAGGEATLEADQQRQAGNVFYADGHVDLRYENVRLQADHVEYNERRRWPSREDTCSSIT